MFQEPTEILLPLVWCPRYTFPPVISRFNFVLKVPEHQNKDACNARSILPVIIVNNKDSVRQILNVKRGPVNSPLWLVLPFPVWHPDTSSCNHRLVLQEYKNRLLSTSSFPPNSPRIFCTHSVGYRRFIRPYDHPFFFSRQELRLRRLPIPLRLRPITDPSIVYRVARMG